MFFVLFGFAMAIFVGWLFWVENEKIIISVTTGLIFGCMIFFLGAILSTGTYQEEAQYVSEIELIQLNNDEVNPIYVVKTDRLNYSYKPIGSKNNEEIIESDNIYLDIVQSDNCEKPALKKYSRKTKWGFFSIGGLSRIEYVFYIPTGTYQGLYDIE